MVGPVPRKKEKGGPSDRESDNPRVLSPFALGVEVQRDFAPCSRVIDNKTLLCTRLASCAGSFLSSSL